MEKIPAHIVTRPKNEGEQDLLLGREYEQFTVKDLNGNRLDDLTVQAPVNGWTHDGLEAIEIPLDHYENGCDFYLGDNWVGSTEL